MSGRQPTASHRIAEEPQAEAVSRLPATSARVIVEHVRPSVDEGRFPIKRTAGETVTVTADIFADGHDEIRAVVRVTELRTRRAYEVPMHLASPGSDEWAATFTVHDIGWYEYSVLAWVDRFETWRSELMAKAHAGHNVSLELLEGSLLLRETTARLETSQPGSPDIEWLLTESDRLSESTPAVDRIQIAAAPELEAVMDRTSDRKDATASSAFRVWVDRERARFSAWYEMFPRSAGQDSSQSGTFHDAAKQLPAIGDLGFDVVYLPPIHPIGVSFRKGRNNRQTAEELDPGSPWAIGSEAGGHTTVDPGLGTLEDFEDFRREAQSVGLEVALDLAWQCSADHPWIREHPEWFKHRPDGTIKYAENPPKKYQDIYPLDFACDEWRALWQELLAVTTFWIDRGIRIFRVDNPHTKTFAFWEWLIREVHLKHPDVIFLAEAFTRPTPMRYLAKAGFSQSYTYFTWRNSKQELVDYFGELTSSSVWEYFRPNLFANTPDILHAYLQTGGRPAFEARLLLAATLGPSYGIYSGFELCEATAVPETEEYLNSEKYEYRKRDWDQPGNIKELIARINAVRHEQPALQFNASLQFCETDNPQLIAYTKAAPSSDQAASPLLVIVNLDPHHMQHGFVDAPFPVSRYIVRDELDGAVYSWRHGWNYVRLEPGVKQGHILTYAG